MLAYKSTQNSLKGLLQSTVVMATYSNQSKGANLNWQNRPLFFLSLFNQSSAVTRKFLRSKLPPVAREFSGSGAFALCFERNCDITPALFDRGAECIGCWTPFVGARVRMTHQPQVRGQHRVAKEKKQEIY